MKLHSKITPVLVMGFAVLVASLGFYIDTREPESRELELYVPIESQLSIVDTPNYELQIGDTEYLLTSELFYTYLLYVELGDGRSIGIKPNGELDFEGDLSEQAVEFWRILAEGVPLFASDWCDTDSGNAARSAKEE